MSYQHLISVETCLLMIFTLQTLLSSEKEKIFFDLLLTHVDTVFANLTFFSQGLNRNSFLAHFDSFGERNAMRWKNVRNNSKSSCGINYIEPFHNEKSFYWRLRLICHKLVWNYWNVIMWLNEQEWISHARGCLITTTLSAEWVINFWEITSSLIDFIAKQFRLIFYYLLYQLPN